MGKYLRVESSLLSSLAHPWSSALLILNVSAMEYLDIAISSIIFDANFLP